MTAATTLLHLAVAAPFVAAAIWFDLRALRFPNALALAAAAAFAALVFATLPQDDAAARLINGAVALGAGLALWLVRAMGPGDAKAAGAFALLIAPRDAGGALFILAAVTLALLIALTIGRIALSSAAPAGIGWAALDRRGVFPFAAAIALAAFAYLIFMHRTAPF